MAQSVPDEAEWLAAIAKAQQQMDVETVAAITASPPRHPVPVLQGPFEESMLESFDEVDLRASKVDPVTRRAQLLEKDEYERVCAGRWKQRPGERYHPLWKLTAQVSFGLHLLAEGQAKSDEEVMKILQSHVDEIDGFLERSTDDFDLATNDIQDRIKFLRLPLEHVGVFDRMLEDRKFRLSIVDGNEKIDHIVRRTSRAMKDAMKDVQKGLDATHVLGSYISHLKKDAKDASADLKAVYAAMAGNCEGWERAFSDLRVKGNMLEIALAQLEGIIGEMQRRAGIISRKHILHTAKFSDSPPIEIRPSETKASKSGKSKESRRSKSDPKKSGNSRSEHDRHITKSSSGRSAPKSPNKPLPLAPNMTSSLVAPPIPARHESHRLEVPDVGTQKSEARKMSRKSTPNLIAEAASSEKEVSKADRVRRKSTSDKHKTLKSRMSTPDLFKRASSAMRREPKSMTHSSHNSSAPLPSPLIPGMPSAPHSSPQRSPVPAVTFADTFASSTLPHGVAELSGTPSVAELSASASPPREGRPELRPRTPSFSLFPLLSRIE